MSYTKHDFKSGEKLYAQQLNEMDEQIFKNTEETSKLSEEIADLKENGTGGETGAVSNVINLEKYGIVQANLESPFTVENYELAYNNGVGIQNAINDAKENGLKTIIIPSGKYPLCYHANTKDEHNTIINSCGIDVEAYGCEFYVIYDEEGINPYYFWTDEELEANGGVKNSYILMGHVFKTDGNICGATIIGERAYRKNENTKWRDSSFGILIDTWADNNKILDCEIHHFSGDGIGNGSVFENVYVSGDVICPSGKMVNGISEASTDSWLSPRLGIGWNVDVSKPIQIAQTGYQYFVWTKKPLSIHCFTQDEIYITTIKVKQGVPFDVPSNTFYVYVEMYSGSVLTADSSTTVNFRFGNMCYFGTVIENCKIYLNQRGGMSNLPSGSVVKNCVIHDNGGAYGDMVAYYDGTQFGIDIEDWYADSITIEDCLFYGHLNDVLFRCNKLCIKNSILHSGLHSLNYAVDVWLESSKFYGGVTFLSSAEFGNKLAINCYSEKGFPSEVSVLPDDLKVFQSQLDSIQAWIDSQPASLITDGLIKHVDFTSNEPLVDKVSGETYVAYNNKTLLFDENGVYSEEDSTHIDCEDFELSEPFTFEVVWYKTFGTGIFTKLNSSTSLYSPGDGWTNYPGRHISSGFCTPTQFTQYKYGEELKVLHDSNILKILGVEKVHIVYRCDGNVLTGKMNGYDLYTSDGSTELAYTATTIEMLAKYLKNTNDYRLTEIRLYNRVLSDKEVENNFKYQQQ